MRILMLIFFLFLFQSEYLNAQTDSIRKIYMGTMEIKHENPIPDNPRHRKLIFTSFGDQSSLEIIDFFRDSSGELIEISNQHIEVDKVKGNRYLFKPSNVNFQLLI
jgi:hypothetical protein